MAKISDAKAKDAALLIESLLVDDKNGCTLKQIMSDLHLSAPLALAGLAMLDAVGKSGGRWALPDDEPEPTSFCVEKPEAPAPVDVPVDATHFSIHTKKHFKVEKDQAFVWVVNQWCKHSLFALDEFDKRVNFELINAPKVEPRAIELLSPQPAPTMTDSGPDWATAPDGATHYLKAAGDWNAAWLREKSGYWDHWLDFEKKWDRLHHFAVRFTKKWVIANPSNPPKSDYAMAQESERTKILDLIKTNGGATAGRIADLTGLHPDDIDQHLDVLRSAGQLHPRPVIVATAWEYIDE